mmetsp:Transcript_28784/g.53975  ORF Transcript_28784/g.53975 Transcript_28784/m.53975 type:complete len:165 (+) Transcript_28784:35-529(+)
MLGVNLTAVILGTHYAAEAVKAAGKKGVIVNTASMGGLLPLPETPSYSASKWGVVGFTVACRPLKKSHGVRVNCICPAMTQTPAVGSFFEGKFRSQDENHVLLKHTLHPAEVADAVIAVIEDEKLNAQAAAVMPHMSYLHNFDFTAVTTQSMREGVKALPRSKL